MVPQQGPCHPAPLAAGAPPPYGQPGFYSHPNQGLNVPVGIPAGVAPVYGSVVHGSNVVPNAALVHVGNAVPIGPHVQTSNMVMGNFPAQSLPGNNQQSFFVQAQQSSFVQPSGSNNIYENGSNASLSGQWQGHPRPPCSPPPSSFPPGFEPRLNNNTAMGVPSQTNSEHVAGRVMHVNQHQLQAQHQQQQESHLELQPQKHFQAHPPYQHQHGHQPQQPFRQHQHFEVQPQQQHQHRHQHQYQRQPQHQHQHQHQHQSQHQDAQQPSTHQNQYRHQYIHSNQHQHRYEFQHQHDAQHQYPLQEQHPSQRQHQSEHQTFQNPQSQPQIYLQAQQQSFSQPQLQAQAHAQPQLQAQAHAQPQPYPACQQMQSLTRSHQPNFQTSAANGVAIGVPVMPTLPNVDATSIKNVVHSQQPTPGWQQLSPLENSSSTPQLLQSTFGVMNNSHDNRSLAVASQGEFYPNVEQPTNIRNSEELHPIDPHREGTHSMSSSLPKFRSGLEGTKPTDVQRVDHIQTNGRMASATNRSSSSIEGNYRNRPSPPRGQLRSGASAGNSSHASRDFQPHSNGQFKFHSNRHFSAAREKNGDGEFSSQRQKHDFRGKTFSKGVAKRSDLQPLRCEPCDRTFTTPEILGSHLNSHVKCGEEGCSFEAAGKIVKEHKVVEHGKVDFQSTYRGRKALALRSKEDKEDIRRWREERKRSYPSSANLLRKAEEKRKREAEGEFMDEEAQQRRQRMLDIIAKQKQLGFQAPEIPSHYFRSPYIRQSKKARLGNNAGPPRMGEEKANADAMNGKGGSDIVGRASEMEDRLSTQKDPELKNVVQDTDALFHDKTNGNNHRDHRNGHFKKGHHNKFSSWQDRRRVHQNSHPQIARWQQPSLLSKLLSKDIEAENSCLLQCCRFIVNNAFLQDCSRTSMKHFEWIAAMSASGTDPSANVMDSKGLFKSEVGEELSASDSEYSECGEQARQTSSSKDSRTEIYREEIANKVHESVLAENVNSCEIEAAAASTAFTGDLQKGKEDQDLTQSGRHERKACLPKGSVKVESDVDSILQPQSGENTNDLVHAKDTQSNIHCNKLSGGVQTSWRPTTTNTKLSSQDIEAGEVASGNSESIVEDEEDISQYMNLDASGADSGCCYD